MRSTQAIRECALAMVQLLSYGWSKSDLNYLEELWWSLRDDDGKLKTPEQAHVEESEEKR